ncbi:hypothetical protein ABTL80_20585, partial [Acinetobacter baumannii]
KVTYEDAAGAGVWFTYTVDSTTLNTDGSTWEAIDTHNADGSVRSQEGIWTSANGLSKTTWVNPGQGFWFTKTTDNTTLE